MVQITLADMEENLSSLILTLNLPQRNLLLLRNLPLGLMGVKVPRVLCTPI
jgi:hypothetical protein